jgi:hypothetical protein
MAMRIVKTTATEMTTRALRSPFRRAGLCVDAAAGGRGPSGGGPPALAFGGAVIDSPDNAKPFHQRGRARSVASGEHPAGGAGARSQGGLLRDNSVSAHHWAVCLHILLPTGGVPQPPLTLVHDP